MDRAPDPSDQRKPSQFNSYLKYSGLAVQMVVTIGVAAWLGYLLDKYLELKFPLFTVLLTMGTFAGVMFQLYRSINK